MTQGERNQKYIEGQHWRVEGRLIPFFGNLGVSEITAGKIQEYRLHRHQEALKKFGKPPGHSTMHQEIVTLRQTLKTALCNGWLDRLPDFSERYRKSPKISHPCVVLTNGIQTTLRSDTSPCARAEETGLQMGGRTASRLCPLRRQYRTATRRGLAPAVPRCHDRFRR
jgi:hypothetical protein